MQTEYSERPALTLPRGEAKERIQQQFERARELPEGASVIQDDEAEKWYDYTAELLRRICTTDELADEFTGRGSYGVGSGDLTVAKYLKTLHSIYERLDLFPEAIPEASTTPSYDPFLDLDRLLSRFHVVTRQLRHRYNSRPTLDVGDEYDVQDLLHALLRIYFDDIRPEEWTPRYAGGNSRMDFLLKAESIVVEVKKTRPGLGAREVGEQLSVDIMRYRAHPDCERLICFVYDPEERILNPCGIEEDLSGSIGDIDIVVRIVQR